MFPENFTVPRRVTDFLQVYRTRSFVTLFRKVHTNFSSIHFNIIFLQLRPVFSKLYLHFQFLQLNYYMLSYFTLACYIPTYLIFLHFFYLIIAEAYNFWKFLFLFFSILSLSLPTNVAEKVYWTKMCSNYLYKC